MIVLLDTGPLSRVTRPAGGSKETRCKEWFLGLLANGHVVAVPEIADYELRRELIRTNGAGLCRLDDLPHIDGVIFLPLDTETMREAARLWAAERNRKPQAAKRTRDDDLPGVNGDIDGDAILAAQASLLQRRQAGEVCVATENARDHFAATIDWTTDPLTGLR